ncbi:unnamed protein product, partial [Protopolystoma xenopodis]
MRELSPYSLSTTVLPSAYMMMNSSKLVVKDRNKPKGAMTAYACFVQVIREEHKKKHPGEQIVFSDFSKKCAERWKVMSPKEKKRFEDMAALDKERYNREMNDYVPPDGVKKAKKRKAARDPRQPKRAWSAFFFFCDEFRAKIKEEHPEWKVADIAKELGRRWEECQEKPKYETLAQQDKQRYEEDMLKYRAGTYVPPKQPKFESLMAGVSASGDGPSISNISIENTIGRQAGSNGTGVCDPDEDDEGDDEVEGDVEGDEGAGDVDDC